MEGLDRQHALDRQAGAVGGGGIEDDLAAEVFERTADIAQRDALHVGAQIAGADELGGRVLRGQIVAHRAFGDEHDAGGAALFDIFLHHRGAAGEIGFVDHFGGAFGVGEDDDAGVGLAVAA